MNDTLSGQNWPTNERIIRRMEKYINMKLGENAWKEFTVNDAPTSGMDDIELSRTTGELISRFDKITDSNMANMVFSQVRHGLTRSDFAWAREKYLQYGDIDVFAEVLLTEQMDELKMHMQQKTKFYGQPITSEVYDYVSGIENLFYGKRYGDKILASAIPFRALDYLHAKDDQEKRYYMCHCQFARESILKNASFSKTICYCSLGHNLMFWETVLDTELKGDVVSSALNGDLSCKFVIHLTDEIIRKHIRAR